jgi:3-isopropylmalate/(R)-2-methylmalate dehydratase small subunit
VKPFRSLTAIAAPLFVPDISTDKLIPARFLRRPLADGYRNFLFYNERFNNAGQPRPGFVLDEAAYKGAEVLVTGRNFACGSSREGAVYVLTDFGIRAVIAPSYGEIFFNSAFQNGLLLISLAEDHVAVLAEQITATPGARLTIELAEQTVKGPDGTLYRFELDADRKRRLLEGLDPIAETLTEHSAIQSFEKIYHRQRPWLT